MHAWPYTHDQLELDTIPIYVGVSILFLRVIFRKKSRNLYLQHGIKINI